MHERHIIIIQIYIYIKWEMLRQEGRFASIVRNFTGMDIIFISFNSNHLCLTYTVYLFQQSKPTMSESAVIIYIRTQSQQIKLLSQQIAFSMALAEIRPDWAC